MKWHAVDKHHWQRECGRYFVDVVQVGFQRRFTAWRKSGRKDGMAENLGCFDTKAAAVSACAADIRAQKAAA